MIHNTTLKESVLNSTTMKAFWKLLVSRFEEEKLHIGPTCGTAMFDGVPTFR